MIDEATTGGESGSERSFMMSRMRIKALRKNKKRLQKLLHKVQLSRRKRALQESTPRVPLAYYSGHSGPLHKVVNYHDEVGVSSDDVRETEVNDDREIVIHNEYDCGINDGGTHGIVSGHDEEKEQFESSGTNGPSSTSPHLESTEVLCSKPFDSARSVAEFEIGKEMCICSFIGCMYIGYNFAFA
ncbi:hypothetical protein Dimus_010178 [Dionaea muscipula]